MADPRHLLGERAERAAAEWLTATGWAVLARRWRCPLGELDLVCRDPRGALVGVEVKARASARAGTGAESVTRERRRRLRAALARYAATAGVRSDELRVDLVELVPATEGRWRLLRTPGIDGW